MVEIRERVPLAPYTTLGVGGSAQFFAAVTTTAELLEAVRFGRERGLAIFILGGGSNLLVSDAGFDGLVVQVAIAGPVVRTGDEVEVPAGMDWDRFVREMCEAGLSGVECLAGIPGLVGGSPVQNIGAYGQEVAETIVAVTALDLESMAMVTIAHAECGFAYRRSIFNSTQRNRYVVTSVRFRSNPEAAPRPTYADLQRHFGEGASPAPLEVYEAVRAIRQAKGMLLVAGDPDCRSAGSFFKNPVVPAGVLTRIAEGLGVEENAVPHWPQEGGLVKLPAAWLVERAGFSKGSRMGAAGISSRHTLALINRGGARAAEIVALRDAVVRGVEERFGIVLEQEPVLVGF
jgi:UDP-N-acetylmuramate dehydrogenase